MPETKETDHGEKAAVAKTAVSATPTSMRVVDLKEELTARGLSPRGLKKELVERLEAALAAEQKSTPAKRSARSEEQTVESIEDENLESEPKKPKALQEESLVQDGIELADTLSQEKLKGHIRAEGLNELATPIATSSLEESNGEQLLNGDVLIQTGSPSHTQPVSPVIEPTIVQANTNTQPLSHVVHASEHLQSRFVHIKNLCRPLTIAELSRKLEEFGPVEELSLDPLKTHAFAQFKTEEAAAKCCQDLTGVTYPIGNPRTLKVDLVPPIPHNQNASSAPNLEKDTSNSESGEVSVDGTLVVAKRLDDIFCKTKTEPALYYLPAKTIEAVSTNGQQAH